MSITSTFWIQMIVFVILALFTMKFIWPPITAALDERAQKIREGLSAADKAKAELANANKRVEEELSAARTDAAQRLADAERLAHSMIEEAKSRANEEGAKIVAAARAEAEQEAMQARARSCASRSPRSPCAAPSRSCAARSTRVRTPTCSASSRRSCDAPHEALTWPSSPPSPGRTPKP